MTVFDSIMLVKMSMTIETMLHVIKTKCQGNSFSLLNVVPNGSTEYHKIKNNNKINGISNMRNVAKVIITAFAFSFRYIGIINLLNPFHKVLKFRAQIAVIWCSPWTTWDRRPRSFTIRPSSTSSQFPP